MFCVLSTCYRSCIVLMTAPPFQMSIVDPASPRARIVSFLPAGSQILFALGLGAQLIGRTHECDFPPEAKQAPVVLKCRFDPNEHSGEEIDRMVSTAMAKGESLYIVDVDAVVASRPDVILTQDLCDVCAFGTSSVKQVLESWPADVPVPKVVSLSARNLEQLYIDIQAVADAAGSPVRGTELVQSLQARIEEVRARVAAGREPVRVACIEWLDPIYNAGHWVPELVRLAGGRDGLASEGEWSMPLGADGASSSSSSSSAAAVATDAGDKSSWPPSSASAQSAAMAKLIACRPDVVILMPCGFDVQRTLRDAPSTIMRQPGWGTAHKSQLPAVRNNRVWAVNGAKLYSGASTHLIDGLELLAKVLHPAAFGGVGGKGYHDSAAVTAAAVGGDVADETACVYASIDAVDAQRLQQ